MAIKRLTLTRGDSKTYTITFKKPDGTPHCIKNWVVFFTIKQNYNLADSDASLQKIITTFADTVSGTSGVATIPIVPEDTVNIVPGEYFWDIQARTDIGNVYTVLKGKIDIEFDVTRSAGTSGTAA